MCDVVFDVLFFLTCDFMKFSCVKLPYVNVEGTSLVNNVDYCTINA